MIQHIFNMFSGRKSRRILPMALFVLLVFGLCVGTAAAAGTLTVYPDSGTAQASGTAIPVMVWEDSSGSALTLTVDNSNPAVAEVIPDSQPVPGVLSYNVIPKEAGQATITFTSSDDLTGTFTLTVNSAVPVIPTVDSISLSSVSTTAAPGSLVTFYAYPVNSTSGSISGKTVNWDASTGGSGTANQNYLISYTVPQTASGDIRLTCSCEGKTAVFTITVGQPTLESIELYPSKTTLGSLETVTVTAVGNDGYQFAATEITWEIGNTSVLSQGSVSGDSSTFKAESNGSTTVTAKVGVVSSDPLSIHVGSAPAPTPVPTTTTPTQSPSYSGDNGGADDGAQLLASVSGQKPGVTPTESSTVSPTTSTGGDSGTTAPGTQTSGDVTPGTEATVSPSGGQTAQPTTPPPTKTQGPVPLFGLLAGLGVAVALGRKYW